MKTISRIVALFLALILVLSLGCAVAEKDSIRIGLARNVTALDGFTGNNTSYGIAYSILDTLVQLNPDSTLRPGIATSWEQVDDYTWRFNIRQGIKFTNGEDLTAESVAYSLNYMASLDTKYQNYKQWGESWPPAAEVESETAVLVKTKAPNLAVPALLTRCAMLPLEASKAEGYFKAPIGTGAYKLVKWDVGVQLVLEANEEYWDGAPAIKTLTYDIMNDATARAAAIKSGDYDFIENVPFDTALELQTRPENNLSLVKTQSTGMWYVYYNGFSTNPAMTNKGIRQALLHAIDHKGIVETILGNMTVSPQNITPMYISGTYDAGGYPDYDPDKAMELAKAAGYNGEEIRIALHSSQFSNDSEVVELIMAELESAGFNVSFNQFDGATWSSQYKKTDAYDISVNGYGGTYTGDSEQYYTQGVRNLGWTFDEAEALLKQIYGEGVTADSREQALQDIIRVCWDETPYLWAAEAVGLWAVNADLSGYEILPHGQFNFIKASLK